MRCRRRFALARQLVLGAIVVSARISLADNFPDHGAAPGSQSGDDATPFVGVAESPGADLFSGAATTSVAIAVPPGRANMTPELALRYSSQAGRSPYGYGWSLTTGRISRSTKHGVPGYDNATDTFVLELPTANGELVKVEGAQKKYRTRIAGAYLDIGFDASANYWVVIDKTGTKFIFGKASADSRTGRDVATSTGTFSWMLERVEDTFGNVIDYAYEPQSDFEDSPPGLPSRVLYGGTSDGVLAHVFEVHFLWDGTGVGPGPVTLHEGFERHVQSRRLGWIETYAVGSLARRYTLLHTPPNLNFGTLQLDSVHALAEPMNVAVPPSMFHYAAAIQLEFPTGTGREQFAVPVTTLGNGTLREEDDDVGWDILDMNGDGLVDYVRPGHSGGDVRLGNGSNFEATARDWNWPTDDDLRFVRAELIDGAGNSRTRLSLFDITGDGLPDLVETYSGAGYAAPACAAPPTTGYYWCVYENNGFEFATVATPWWAPEGFIRNVDGDSDLRRDTIDIDGDGKPDFVDGVVWSSSSTNPYYRSWRVYLNTGSGFARDDPIRWLAPLGLISKTTIPFGNQPVVTVHGLVDLNGDGLADFVDATQVATNPPFPGYTDRWRVYYNTGAGFDGVSAQGITPSKLWYIDGAPAGSQWLTTHYAKRYSDSEFNVSFSRTQAELVDMTSDGLPDLVRAYGLNDTTFQIPPGECPGGEPVCTGGAAPPGCCYMNLVFVNSGEGFLGPVGMPSWDSSVLGAQAIRHTGSDGEPHDLHEFDLFDFDGDGLVDLFERYKANQSAPEEWHVYRNPASPLAAGSSTPDGLRTKPGLLVSMMNGLGGETVLQYAPASMVDDGSCSNSVDTDDTNDLSGRCSPYPSWVVTDVTLGDVFEVVPPVTTHYEYRDALYDAGEREGRGFGLVWATAADGITTARYFHQDTACSGRVGLEITFGSAGAACDVVDLRDLGDPCNPKPYEMVRQTSDWDCEQALATLDEAVPFPVLLRSLIRTPWRRTTAGALVEATDHELRSLEKTTTYEYDEYGNETARAMASPSAETLTTRTEYDAKTPPTTAGMPKSYVVSRPTRIFSHYGSTMSDRFQEKTIAYGNDYAVTEVAECRVWGGGGSCLSAVATKSSGHKYGQPTTISGPGSAVTRHSYDPYILYPRTTTHADKLPTSIDEYDYRIGKAVKTSGKDGQLAVRAHDGLGRLREVWGPGFDAQTDNPELRVTYSYPDIGAVAPGTVREEAILRQPRVKFYDGFARLLAVKTEVEVLQANGTYALATRIDELKAYDDAGRVQYGALPLDVTATDPDVDLLGTAFSQSLVHTEVRYDQRTGTRTEIRLPGPQPTGSVEIEDVTVPGVTAAKDAKGLVTLEYTDAYGRATLREHCSTMPVLANGARCASNALLSRTRFVYDGLDRVVAQVAVDTATGAEATVEVVVYDGLGQVIQRLDANSQIWRYAYSERSGLLLETETPRGDVISRKYDSANRLKLERATDASPARRDSKTKYRYFRHSGLLGAGQIERIDFNGPSQGANVTRSFTYDHRGRVAKETVETEGAQSDDSAYSSFYTYDDADRVVSTTYPAADAAGGLVNDLLHTVYAPDGQIAGIYREAADGQLQLYASAGYDILGQLTYLYYGNDRIDLSKFRGTDDSSHLECSRTTSDVSALPDEACADDPASDVRAVRYAGRDLTGRITTIDDLLYGNGVAHTGHQSVSYDTLGRLAVVGYTPTVSDTFQYDTLGRLTRRDATTYVYGDTSTPYAVTRLEVGAQIRTIGYDPNGNRIAKADADYEYTPGGALAAAEEAGDLVQESAYGPEGLRVARYDSGTITHYYDGRFEIEGDTLVRHFYLGDRRIASDRVSAPGGLDLSSEARRRGISGSRRERSAAAADSTVYYHVDHLGSPQAITDSDGALVELIRYGALGEVRGVFEKSGSTIVSKSDTSTNLGFSGHEPDDATGLVYFGARHLDPEDGYFLTADPARQFASPYVHAGYDPVNVRDPDGRFGQLAALGAALAIGSAFPHFVAAAADGDFNAASRIGIWTTVGAMGFSDPTGQVVQVAAKSASAATNPMVGQFIRLAYAGGRVTRDVVTGDVSGAVLDVVGLALGVAAGGEGAGGGSEVDGTVASADHELYLGARFTESDAQGGKVGIGHSYVGLRTPDGTIETYGFYPRAGAEFQGLKALANVPGQVVPDRDFRYLQSALAGDSGHSVVQYSITRSQYLGALDVVTSYQSQPYNAVLCNCTSFAVDVANGAGVQAPFAGIVSRPAVFEPALRRIGASTR